MLSSCVQDFAHLPIKFYEFSLFFGQEVKLDVRQLSENYSWLMDIHLFVCEWSPASLEFMVGQPALLYEEHIKKIRHWTGRISTVPSSIPTSSRLFIIQCTDIKENLGMSFLIKCPLQCALKKLEKKY